MNISELLCHRDALLRQAHLANLAFAHERLGDFVARISRGRLRGPVCLKRADDDAGRPWPSLTALLGHQSVIEEHFSDEDIVDLVDVIAYALDVREPELVFDLEDVTERFQRPVRLALREAGVRVDESASDAAPREEQGGLESPAREQDER